MFNFKELEELKNSYFDDDISISRLYYMAIFRSLALPMLPQSPKVAIVGGDLKETELKFMDSGAQISVYGIGPDDIHLDLNEPSQLKEKFDLVIFNQVLEHIWNHQLAFNILKDFLVPNGVLWVTCPFSNFYHEAPDFYSSGFSPKYLKELGNKSGLRLIDAGAFGSERLYLFQHMMKTWPSVREYFSPIAYHIFDNRFKLGINHKKLFNKDFLKRCMISRENHEITLYKGCLVETWGIFST